MSKSYWLEVLKSDDNNAKHQDAARVCKAMLSKKSIITDSSIGPKVLGKRELKKRYLYEYTNILIDCFVYWQTGDIALRGLDETKSPKNQGNFLRAVNLLRNCVPDFD